METIKVGNKDGRRQHEQEPMSEKKIRIPEQQFDNFDDKLPNELRHDMRANPTLVHTIVSSIMHVLLHVSPLSQEMCGPGSFIFRS